VLKLSKTPKVFVISAKFPERFDLPELKHSLSREKSTNDVQHSLQLATQQRVRSLLQWIDAQDLAARTEHLRRLETEASEMAASRLAQPLIEQAIPRMLQDPGHRLAITDELLARRVARWPLVNLVHTLLWPLLGFYRVSAAPRTTTGSSLVEEYLTIGNHPLPREIQSTFAALHRSHPQTAQLYRTRKLWEDIPADAAAMQLQTALAAALDRQRATALDRSTGRNVLFAPIRWLLTIGAVLWFPFVQPLLEIVLANGSWPMSRQALLVAVQLLGATYMLKSAGFLVIWFVFLWLVLRRSSARRVNKLLSRSTDNVLATATITWLQDLLDPIRQAGEQCN